VKNWFQAFAFKWLNLYRYATAALDVTKVGLYKLNAVDP
jgi:hypothetical protein